jgi:HECT-like Ubiquitin-conjugating enzyme (E2)-binding
MKFFAEGLPRLGVVNLHVALNSASTEATSITTTEDDTTIILQHQHEEFVILLPSSPSATETIPLPPGKSIITSRLSISRPPTDDQLLPLLSANDVLPLGSQGTTLSCVDCRKSQLVTPQMRWKDLPSDSWVELSDYWLCHSGSTHSHNHEHHTPVLPTLKTRPGTVLVGLTSLLLHPDDLPNITIKVPLSHPLNYGLKRKYLSAAITQRGADTKVLKKSFTYPLFVDS